MNPTQNNKPKTQDDFMRIQDLLYLCKVRWYWFIISLGICLSVAYLYVRKTPPTYVRQASVLLKDEAQSGASSVLSDVELFKTKSNVENEIIAFQAPELMKEVVHRLNLDVDYVVEGKFHDATLYGGALPINVKFDSLLVNDYITFTVKLLDDRKVRLSDFILNGKETGGNATVEGELFKTIKTPVGNVSVLPTEAYRKYTFPIQVRKSTLGAATGRFCGGLGVSLSGEETSIINLSYIDVSPRRAEDILNTLIEVYNENWIKDKNQIAVSTSQFINERLAVIEKELGDVDDDISSFKSRNLLADVASSSSRYIAKSEKTEDQLDLLNNNMYMARYVKNYMTSEGGKNQLLPVNTGIEASGIEAQISEYNRLQLQRNQLVKNGSEKNPAINQLDYSLASLHGVIVSSLDNYIETLSNQIKNLQKTEAATTSRISESPLQAKYLLSVERQQKVKESLYLFLLQKREESELSQAFTAYNTRILQPASGSSAPVAPAKKNIYLVAFAFGLFAPAIFIFLRETMNTRVRGRQDLNSLSMPFVGEIPLYRKRRNWWERYKKPEKIKSFIVKERKRDLLNEAFRVLRTNLEFMVNKDAKSNVILLTSFNPGSGKTFLMMNVAVSLAIKGKRVLAIDGDMRHASASTYIDSPSVGIADYLAHKVDNIDEIIYSEGLHKNLNVIPVGTIPPNPTEILEDKRLHELIEAMKEKYDYILIDCPPIELVADTQIIEREADRTIFVVRAELLERSMLPELEYIYETKKFKNMSLILNGTKGNGGSYGYGYKYGYHYGYGYGYHYGSSKD